MQPETKYAWLGPDRIAYQVLGDGPPDLVVSFGFFGQVDIAWEDPGLALFLRTLASFSRLILFDRRGSGASDPVVLDSGRPALAPGPDRARRAHPPRGRGVPSYSQRNHDRRGALPACSAATPLRGQAARSANDKRICVGCDLCISRNRLDELTAPLGTRRPARRIGIECRVDPPVDLPGRSGGLTLLLAQPPFEAAVGFAEPIG